MNKKKILFSDIDGTLISYDRIIPQINLEAIEKFKSHNNLFTIASGRSIEAVRTYAVKTKINAPAVVSNGSIIYDYQKEEIIWDARLPKNVKEYIQRIFDEFKDIGIEIHSGHELFVLRHSKETLDHISHEKIKYIEINSLSETNEVWHKVLFAADHEKLKELENFCKINPCKGVKLVFTAPVYFEMLHENADKGVGLKELSNILNIENKDTYAIGDYYNDKEMLDSAGYSFLVGGAPDGLKQLADKVVCKCEDGAVAECIDIILNGVN